ncbi:MAG: hypothetical protein C6H99_02945 [Epsilonproteobacteria bacterium]|nr:hypothetical protein [Campylobacterota bacterium]NPA63500.1 DUF4197 domain-containing protein [Campylobacterota bacterium]
MKKLTLSAVILSLTLQAGFLDKLQNAAGEYMKSSNSAPSAASVAGDQKTTGAIKQALEMGVKSAVSTLGKKDGFYKSPFKIPLPSSAQTAAKVLRSAGMGKYVDQFELSMNRAAEEAIPETASVLMETIKGMKLEDAKRLVASDKPNAITEYFKTHAGEKLSKKIAPIIKKHMESQKVTKYYQTMMEYYAKYGKDYTSNKYAQAALGALGMQGAPKEQDLSSYVTNKALDALYKVIEQKEKAIRSSAAARSTKLLQEVFGGAR